MTTALTFYSLTFMRYAMAVTPKNYLLFACHFVNGGSQLTQGYRWLQYNKNGGKEEMERLKALDATKDAAEGLKSKAEGVVGLVEEKVGQVVDGAKKAAGK